MKLEKLCNEGILKEKFQIIERKGLTRALEFMKNFQFEWIKVVLSRIHDIKYSLKNRPIENTKKIIHRVTCYPTIDRKKTMRSMSLEEIEANIGVDQNRCGLSITNIFDPIIELVESVIAQKLYQLSRLNSVPCMIVDQAWKIIMKDHECDLPELQRLQLAENLKSIRKEKNSMFKFGYLILCILFYIQKYFYGIGDVVWDKQKPMIRQINEYVMNASFDEFKKRMKKRIRILEDLVTKYYSDIHFLVDMDTNFVQEMKPRTACLQIFDYEIDSDVVSANIDALLKEEIDFEAKIFGKYDEAKEIITINIKIASKEKKRKKMIEYLEAKLGTLIKGKESLKLTQGLCEDKEQDSGDEEEEEGDK